MELPLETISRRRHLETLVVLAALALMAYAGSFTAGFPWDNGPLILDDPRVHSVAIANLRDILAHGYWWPNFESGLYRPLTTLSFLFNYAVLNGADQPAGYHVCNFLLHAGNAFLVYLLVLRLARQYWPAFFAAALWVLHPVATEAVTNIIGRADELAALGVLGALLAYIQSTEASGGRRIAWLCATAAATALAVFSKENGVMILGIVPLYDFTSERPRPPLRALAKSYAFVALPVLAMLAVRWEVLRHAGAMEIPFTDNPLALASGPVRWATAVRVIGKYGWLLVWPATLSIDYSYDQIPLAGWHAFTWRDGASAAALLILLFLAIVWRRRSRTGFFLLGFSALTLLPATNLLVLTGTIMAERLLYLPAVGFAAGLSIGIYRLARNAGMRPTVAAIILAGIGAAYGVRTYRRNPAWQDNGTLFTAAVAACPNSFKTHMGLANARLVQDPGFLQGEMGIEEAEKAAAIVSSLPDDRNSTAVFSLLGAIYCARGDSLARKDTNGNPLLDPANASWYRKALAADLRALAIDHAQNENHRRAELARGTPPRLVAEVGSHDVYGNLGRAYLRLGDAGRALEAFRSERRRAPALSYPYANLASAYLALGRTEDAATTLMEAFALDDSPETRARVMELYGRLAEGSCAAVADGWNRDCPIVRRDLCNAARDLGAAVRAGGMADRAARLQAAAEHDAVCR